MGFTQADRRFAVTAPNGEEDLLLLREMTMQESISGMFRIQLSCLSESSDIKFDDMIGGPISIKMVLPDGGDASERYWHGVVARFSQGPPVAGFFSYHAEVVPWLWFLTRGSDCRIFQRMNVPDIIAQVFDDLGMTDYELQLNASYGERDYCVQYRETHFNFVTRMMEEAGIAYYFEHSNKGHNLILFDDPAGNEAVPYAKTAVYASAEDDDRPAGEIEDWSVEQVMPSGKYAVTDYNMEDPSMDLMAETASTIKIGNNDRFQIYDYPGEYAAVADGQGRVTLRMEAEESASFSIRGRSSRGDFASGCTFDLVGHYRSDFDDTYLLTSVLHHASQGYGQESGGSSYSNSFSCIPHSVPFRPVQRTPKPIISGAQTAVIVGAKGEEIDVDEHGRVVVQFHWDREGKKDENSSLRVRVAQSWAGKGWGAIFNPRIGQEVVVEFLEGDPDRPIVTGCVYNGEHKVPYSLPANKTQSGLKSHSSKQGGNDNFNEIRFEDKKGDEQLYIRAEKNRETLVKNDETKTIVANKTLEVKKDLKESISGNKDVTVDKDHTEGIQGNQSLAVTKDRDRKVQGEESISITKDHSISVGGGRTLSVGKDMKVTVSGDVEESFGKNHSEETAKNYGLTAQKIVLEAKEQITLKVGKAELVMKKSGDIDLKGSKINIKGSGDVILKGSKIKAN